jgi:hypothetical protein
MGAVGYRGPIFIARGLCHGWKAGDRARIKFDHKRKVLEVEVGRQGVRLTEQAHQSGRGAWDQVVSGRGERGEQTRPYWASPREKGAREPHRRATRERGRG